MLLPRQRYAFLFTAVSAPVVAAASRLSWPWVMTTVLLAAAVLVGLHYLQSRSASPLAVTTRKVWGRGLGAGILAVQLLFAAVFLGQLALGAASAFPDDKTAPFVPLTLLAVCAWAAWQGRAAAVRAVGVLFFFLAGLYLTVFASSVKAMEFSRLAYVEQEGNVLPLAVVLLLPLYGQYLQTPREEKGRFPVLWLLAFVLLPVAASMVCTAVPGARGTFYNMAKSVEVVSFAQRLEPLVSCATTIGWFAALALTAVSAGEMAGSLGVPPRWGAMLVCLPAAGIVLAGRPIAPEILLPAGAICCVILPLLTQFVGQKKTPKNKQKKC